MFLTNAAAASRKRSRSTAAAANGSLVRRDSVETATTINTATAASSSLSTSSLRRRLTNEFGPLTGGGSVSLKGVVICVTGLTPEVKARCHYLVELLGGSYTGHLDSSQNTHLIAQVPEGPKYHVAISCPNMFVVKPSWLEACFTKSSRVAEQEHLLLGLERSKTTPEIIAHGKVLQPSSTLTLSEALHELLQEPSSSPSSDVYCNINQLFAPCHFVMVGFDDESEELFQLGRLIRRGWGTIYWEMNESATHLIIADGCVDTIRNAVRAALLQHPDQPATVSPWWILSSWKDNRLASTESYPPKVNFKKTKAPPKKQNSTCQPTCKTSSLFRGCLFILVRLAALSEAVDFDNKHLEDSIRKNGGQLLSLKLVEALRIDMAQTAGRQRQQTKKEQQHQRTCFVVCWGGAYVPAQLSLHPLVSQIKRHLLAKVELVTPIWLQTCIADETQYQATTAAGPSSAILFQPQSWPLRHLDGGGASKKGVAAINISISGFVAPERTGIVQLIQALGAFYHDTMRTTNSHLICKASGAMSSKFAPTTAGAAAVATGPKFLKAVEWGLHVVTVEWLFHVAQYGYGGQQNCAQGCEDLFSLVKPKAILSSKSRKDADEAHDEAAG